VKLGGYIHIFRTIVLPPTSPLHSICLSESLVTVLTKETRDYTETPVPISQSTWRQILEDKSGLFSGTVFECSMEQVARSVVLFQGDRRNRSESVYATVWVM